MFKRGAEDWPAGARVLHVYAVVDLRANPELRALVQGVRAACGDAPLAHIGDEWLHVTLYQAAQRPEGPVTPVEVRAMLAELRTTLAGMPPVITLRVGSALVYSTGVIFDLGPDEPLAAVADMVADAMNCVYGRTYYDTGVLHLTESYATGHLDADGVHELSRRLRRVRPSTAPLDITAIQLVDVMADQDRKTIEWDSLATVELRTGLRSRRV